MKLIIYRGTQEIGGTCAEISTQNSRILIDFGIPLVSSKKDQPFDSEVLTDKSIEELKNLSILPDIKGLYRNQSREIDAILISHSHLDHYGLLKYVHPDIPIYMSEGAKELIGVSELFIPHKTGKLNIRIFSKTKREKINDFEVTVFLVDHSAFDACAFLMDAEGKRLFYSGDFRGHGRKSTLFRNMLENPPKNIDCLLMEGSMLGRGEQVYQDEKAVEERIAEVLRENNAVNFLFCSSQNIDRLVSAYRACLKTDSLFVIDIYTAFILDKLKNISKVIPQFNWKNIRVKFLLNHREALLRAGFKELLDSFGKQAINFEGINKPGKKVLMLARNNSIFPLIIKKIKQLKGSIILYSMWEGYLTPDFKEFCRRRGLRLEVAHTSGHATLEDLRRFANAINPKVLIPIHTFAAKSYPKLFKNVRILQDGEELGL